MLKRGKKGFTLAELLIVVAIIAVLVAIAVPLFISGLQRAQNATFEANKRAARSAVVVSILGDEDFDYSQFTKDGKDVTLYYDVKVEKNGKIGEITKSTKTEETGSYKAWQDDENNIITVGVTRTQLEIKEASGSTGGGGGGGG